MSDLDYSCYAYFCIDYAHNTYPVRDAEHNVASLLSLKEGDLLYLKGVGDLQVINLNVDNFAWTDGLYQEIAVSCIKI